MTLLGLVPVRVFKMKILSEAVAVAARITNRSVSSPTPYHYQALKRGQGGCPVTIVGDDTDLFVILAATATASDNIFILKTGTGTRPSKVIDSQTMLKHLGGVRRFVAFCSFCSRDDRLRYDISSVSER